MGRVSDFKEHLEAVWGLFGVCLETVCYVLSG